MLCNRDLPVRIHLRTILKFQEERVISLVYIFSNVFRYINFLKTHKRTLTMMNRVTTIKSNGKKLLMMGIIGSVASLAGCGGGGSGGSGGTSTPTPTPIATLNPADGDINVEPNVVITAAFSGDIVEDGISNSTFDLVDEGGNPVDGSASCTNDLASFSPAYDLGLLRTYTATIDETVSAIDGEAVASFDWSFTTRDGEWSGAETFETDDVVSHYPKIKTGPNGTAVAVWANNADVYANIFDGTNWGTPENIENTALGHTDLSLATDLDGNALAIWAHWDGTVNHIRAAYYNSTTMTWGADVELDPENDNDARYPKAAFDGFGRAIAVWLQSDGTADSIYSARFEPSGNGWGTPALIETASGVAYAPDISVDDGGDAIAVWTQDNLSETGAYDAIYAAYYTVDGAWVEQGEIGENVGADENASNVSIKQDGDGNAIAIWHQLPAVEVSTFPSVWVRRYSGGSEGSWQGVAEELDTEVLSATAPSLAFDNSGNAMATWISWDENATRRVRTIRYQFNAGWTSIQNADESTSNVSNAILAVDPQGHAIVAWRENSNDVGSVWANRYQANVGWGTPELLEADDTNIAIISDVAIDWQGYGYAIWAQMDPNATQNKIWVNRFE